MLETRYTMMQGMRKLCECHTRFFIFFLIFRTFYKECVAFRHRIQFIFFGQLVLSFLQNSIWEKVNPKMNFTKLYFQNIHSAWSNTNILPVFLSILPFRDKDHVLVSDVIAVVGSYLLNNSFYFYVSSVTVINLIGCL